MVKNSSSIQEQNPTSNKDVMIMLEQMNGSIQLIAEGQQGLVVKIDNLETRFDGLETRFDGLETKFDKFEEETSQKFNLLFDFLSRIEDELVSIRTELTLLKDTKAEKTDITNLEKRLGIAESEILKLRQKQVA